LTKYRSQLNTWFWSRLNAKELAVLQGKAQISQGDISGIVTGVWVLCQYALKANA